MTTTLMLDRPVAGVSEMMREMYPISLGWDHMDNWLEWACEQGFLGQIWKGDALVGVAVARPCRDVQKAAGDYYHYDLTGPILWVDISCSPLTGGLANLWYMAVLRFGVREGVAFRRNGGRVRMYDFKRFSALVAGGA